jgi:glucose-6-phosphate isomerase, archaeal
MSLLAPFTTVLDLADGVLTPQRKLVERTLGDMDGMYAVRVPESRLDEVVYRVSEVPVPLEEGNLLSSTTTLEPGTVATEEGELAVEPMRRGTVNYVPGGWAHRSVNVGSEPLVFLAAFPADAGYDYKTIEEQGFPVLIVERDSGPEVVPNPRYRG